MRVRLAQGAWALPAGAWALPAGMALLAGVTILSFCMGRYPLSPAELARFVVTAAGIARGLGLDPLAPDHAEMIRSVLLESRLPRILGAILVGAGLSVSGASFQAVFRNPLVSPGLLGVLIGAGFGAALAIVLGGHAVLVQCCAFAGGVAAVAVGVTVARLFSDSSIIMLVFGGLISNALFTSLLSILKYGADPNDQLPNIVFWLLGSLAQVSTGQLLAVAPLLCIGIVLLSWAGRLLDALVMSDDEARTLGVPVTAVRYGVILLATIVSALTVSFAGMIGWVGLIIPHIARLIVGPGNTRLLPLSACIGAIFLLLSDGLARTLFVEEIPIGIITELLGVVIFLLVLPQARKGW